MPCRATARAATVLLQCRGGTTMKPQTILVPLDGSTFSRQIIPHLVRLYDPRTHNLLLLRVAELPVGVTGAPWPISSTFPLPTCFSERDFERARFPIYAAQVEQSARSTLERG